MSSPLLLLDKGTTGEEETFFPPLLLCNSAPDANYAAEYKEIQSRVERKKRGGTRPRDQRK